MAALSGLLTGCQRMLDTRVESKIVTDLWLSTCSCMHGPHANTSPAHDGHRSAADGAPGQPPRNVMVSARLVQADRWCGSSRARSTLRLHQMYGLPGRRRCRLLRTSSCSRPSLCADSCVRCRGFPYTHHTAVHRAGPSPPPCVSHTVRLLAPTVGQRDTHIHPHPACVRSSRR